ncbi:tyrosine-type recombinase/integrase [Bacillus atrophaeus]|nr:tyrosine-type recombinase/integrase [Bacillus atrophaeus]MCY8818761.1 tyrosine-type recombinase/integrase [Bacillus atrophaeus]MEC0767122.1 tyrosine-type recombinase/integrase [Bacillus atrophaeus]MEC0779816.1 tyrosine-type recombinase/integrase [Bacillus atrophaeus]MEC0808857.1 tyrosine-type recombinase/integrase [Bacillus atrophaeus]MEC1727713.1 tyrosine-type recombinase/integrase [Bacillus atrophaeus]
MPIHGLRHTHAALLLESGANMKFVQERLGHKNITITSDVYF